MDEGRAIVLLVELRGYSVRGYFVSPAEGLGRPWLLSLVRIGENILRCVISLVRIGAAHFPDRRVSRQTLVQLERVRSVIAGRQRWARIHSSHPN